MNKIELKHLDCIIYHEKLDNGLNIYVSPKSNVNNIYVTFSTDYGSVQEEFVPYGERKMIKVPRGIAHFLEHKMFEQKDGVDPFTFFGERGSDANANTNNYKTTYLFSGTDFFEENINYLLDYVQDPYFTDENVEKEKGIIEQEIKMYQDDPYSRLYEASLFYSFNEHPIKYPIIGSVKSVNSITKEDLYKCYNTFYHPSNMFVVVTGNVDPDETIRIIADNQKKKKFSTPQKIKVKSYKESDEVASKKEVIKLNVTIPKVTVNYKINFSKVKNISRQKIQFYLMMFFILKFGSISELNEQLRKDKIITEDLDISRVDTNDHFLFMIMGESENPEELIKQIQKEIRNITIAADDLNRKKKAVISSLVYMTDNIKQINHTIMNELIKYKEIKEDSYDVIKSLDINELNDLLKQISFDNSSVVIVDKK